MNTLTKSSLAALACICATACGSVPKKKFIFDVIDHNQNQHPALVVVDDDWEAAKENNQVVNVGGKNELEITIPFRTPRVDITIAPLELTDDKKIVRWPKSRTDSFNSDFQSGDPREIFITDPKRQLFIIWPDDGSNNSR
jgi:hypothetical protein